MVFNKFFLGLLFLSTFTIKVYASASAQELAADFAAENCQKFIKPNGEYGTWGETIIGHINLIDQKENGSSKFFDGNISNIKVLCPNWENLDDDEMLNFWVWFLASIAYVESSCRETVKAKTTDGYGVGLYQLNSNSSNRSWRDGDSGDSCGLSDMSNGKNNIKCAIEIMHEFLKGKKGLYKSSGSLVGKESNSYWQHLRKSDGGKIGALTRKFAICH